MLSRLTLRYGSQSSANRQEWSAGLYSSGNGQQDGDYPFTYRTYKPSLGGILVVAKAGQTSTPKLAPSDPIGKPLAGCKQSPE